MLLSLPWMHRQWTKYSLCQKVLYYPKNLSYKGEKSLIEFRKEKKPQPTLILDVMFSFVPSKHFIELSCKDNI